MKGVGRIYQQTFIDTYAPENAHGAFAMPGVGIAKLAACPPAGEPDRGDGKTALIAVTC